MQMVVTAKQIRAGRALLEWSQDDLARASGLSITTIRNLEAGFISGRQSTYRIICTAMEKAGVQFTHDGGVKPVATGVHVYAEHAGYEALFQDMADTCRQTGMPVVGILQKAVIVDMLADLLCGSISAMPQSMTFQLLLPMMPTDQTIESPFEIRLSQPHLLGGASFLNYGKKHCVLLREGRNLRIVTIESSDMSLENRQFFHDIWTTARPCLPVIMKKRVAG